MAEHAARTAPPAGSFNTPTDWSSFAWDVHHAKLAALWAYDKDKSFVTCMQQDPAFHDFLPETLELNEAIPQSEMLPHVFVVARRQFSTSGQQLNLAERVLFIAFRGTDTLDNIVSDLQGWNTLQAQGRCHAGFARLADTFPVAFVRKLLAQTTASHASGTTTLRTVPGDDDDDTDQTAEEKPLLQGAANSKRAKAGSSSATAPAVTSKLPTAIDRIVFCGHSLGAAVGSLVFLKFMKEHRIGIPIVCDANSEYVRPLCSMVGFGTPMFCDDAFAGFVRSQHRALSGSASANELPLVHFINVHDVVPRNLVLFGRRAIGTGVDGAADVLKTVLGASFGWVAGTIAKTLVDQVKSLILQVVNDIQEYSPLGTYYSITPGHSAIEGPIVHRYMSDEIVFRNNLRHIDAPSTIDQLRKMLSDHGMVHYREFVDILVPSRVAPDARRARHADQALASPAHVVLRVAIPEIFDSISVCSCKHPGVEIGLQGTDLDMLYLPSALRPARRSTLAQSNVFAINSLADVLLKDFQLPEEPTSTRFRLSATKPDYKPELSMYPNVQFVCHGLYKHTCLIVDSDANERRAPAVVTVGPQYRVTLRIDRTSVLERLGRFSQGFMCRAFALLTLTPDVEGNNTQGLLALPEEQRRPFKRCLVDLIESLYVLRVHMKVNEELQWRIWSVSKGSDDEKVLAQMRILDGYLFQPGTTTPKPAEEVADKMLADFRIEHNQQGVMAMTEKLTSMLQLSQAFTTQYGATPHLHFLPTAKVVLGSVGLAVLGAGGIAGVVVAAVFSAPILVLLGAIGGAMTSAAAILGGGIALYNSTQYVPFQLGPQRAAQSAQQLSKNLVSIISILNIGKRTDEQMAEQLPKEEDLFLHYLLEKIIRDELFPNGSWDASVIRDPGKWRALVQVHLNKLGLYENSIEKMSQLIRSALVFLQLRELMSRHYIVGIVGDTNTGKSTLIQALLDVAHSPGRIKVGHVGERRDEHTSGSAFCLPSSLLKKYNDGLNATQIVVCEMGGNPEQNQQKGNDAVAMQWILSVADALIVVVDGAAAKRDLPASFRGGVKVPQSMQMMVLVNRCDLLTTQSSLDACLQFTEDVRVADSIKDVRGHIPFYLSSLTMDDNQHSHVLNRTQTLDTVLGWMAERVNN